MYLLHILQYNPRTILFNSYINFEFIPVDSIKYSDKTIGTYNKN